MFGFYKDFTLCPQMFRSSPYVQSVGIRCDPKVRRTKLNPSPPPPPGDPRCATAGSPDMGSITLEVKISQVWGHFGHLGSPIRQLAMINQNQVKSFSGLLFQPKYFFHYHSLSLMRQQFILMFTYFTKSYFSDNRKGFC